MTNLTSTIQTLATSVADDWGRVRIVESICYSFTTKLEFFKNQFDTVQADRLKEEERCNEAGESSSRLESLYSRELEKGDTIADVETLLKAAKAVYKKESGQDYVHGGKRQPTVSKDSRFNEYMSRWNKLDAK